MLLCDVDLRGANITETIFIGVRMGPIRVFGVTGKAAEIAHCGAEDIDFSEKSDGSDIRDQEYLYRSWLE